MPRAWRTFSMRRRICLAAMLLVLPLVAVGGCRQEPGSDIARLGGETMGTTWSAAVRPVPAGTDPAALQAELQRHLDRINGLMSTYDPASEVSRFNAWPETGWFAVSPETAAVIGLAQEISHMTEGAFDISVGPLVELWGFGAAPHPAKVPSAFQLATVLASVGYEKLHLRNDPPAIRKELAQLQIDLSAIAKGYAVDVLAEQLEQRGVVNYLVEIGGELKAAGLRSADTPWRIAIEKPLEDRREVATVFPLTDTALATSGNYRNFFIEDGQRYAHTLDPATGLPVRHRLASVTVLDSSCARADALATALMVMGEDRAYRFSTEHDIPVYFFIHQNEALTSQASPAFDALLNEAAP